LFDEKASKIRSFVIACKLYLRIRMKGMMVEEQVE